MARSTSGESVLERAARILEVFDSNTTSASVTDIAARARLPLSTASRLVDELICHGLLSRDIDRRVQIGVRLWEIGTKASSAGHLREAAMPSMIELQNVTGHHVLLGVVENDEVVFVGRLHATNRTLAQTRIATRIPLHASACGLAILAHASPPIQDRILQGPLPRYTDSTITGPQELRTALSQIRRTGVAVCPGFINPQLTAVAAPVWGAEGAAVCALSMLLPRMDSVRVCIPMLASAVQRISTELISSGFLSAATPRDIARSAG